MLAPIIAIALTSITAQVAPGGAQMGASSAIQSVQDLETVTTGVGFAPAAFPGGGGGSSLSTAAISLDNAHGAGLLTQATDTGRASVVQSATSLAVRVVISTAGKAN